MICDKCEATMDERKIFGYQINGNFEFYCDRCTPYRDEGQKAINDFNTISDERK